MPKVFGFFLTPLYTSYLTTKEYGITDIISNTAGLLGPIVQLGLPSAVLRFTIENKNDSRPVIFALRVFSVSMFVFAAILFLTQRMFNIKCAYMIFIFLLICTSILYDILMSYTKALEKMNVVTICGIGNSIICIICNVLFIAVLRAGVYGFLASTVVGYVFTLCILAVSNRKSIGESFGVKISGDFGKEMLHYGIPLVLSGLSWWVVSSSDRYVVTWLCGPDVNGIYAVAYKIPTILQAVYSVFAQAWIYTLYDTYKTEEGRRYIEKVYELYSFVLCGGCSFLIATTIPVAHFIYKKGFYEAWKYVPVLLLSIVFLGLGNFLGGFLNIYKKSKIIARLSMLSSVINLILNYILIVCFKDAMGAAVATAITFFVSYSFDLYYAIKIGKVNPKVFKQLVTFCILIIQAILMIITENVIISIGICILILVINVDNIRFAIQKAGQYLNRYIKK